MEKVTASSKFGFGSKIAKRIKTINQELDEIAKLKDMYGLEYSDDDQNTEPLDRMTASFVDDSKIVGREHDKSRIVKMLLKTNPSSSSDNFSPQVISIVGMGGLGKTTLAQLVYKDNSIVSSFMPRAWVCISENFDIFLILRKILESFTGKAWHLSNDNVVVKEVHKNISGKKFLLVLDDLWNENTEDWDKFKGCLSGGAQGSKILVTTRKESVVRIVKGTIPLYNLTILSNQECWSIIKNRAFSPGGAVETETMSQIGEEISRKCAGLPLAANFLGGLMRFNNKESDWLEIRDNEVFNTPDNPNKIILILKLSYDNLSSHLKKCFSYCSLFPKDSLIRRETLIQLWVAEGFIHPSNGGNQSTLEDIGNNYFLSLLSSSFFQVVYRDEKLGHVGLFKIHDLVHDLALSVVGSHEVTIRNASEMKNDVSQIRRLLLTNERMPFDVLNKATKLRTTFFQEEGFVFPSPLSNKRLRVIHRFGFSAYGSLKMISSSSLKFKHMRYLDLSHSYLEDVHAESIHQLYNLQTLNLRESMIVQKILKEGIGSLINLRHLDLYSSDANLLPDSITRLTDLQTLSISNCRDIRALPINIGHLQNLSSLDISGTKISELPESICLLYNNLTKFYFSQCNQLKALPRNFEDLTQLRSLDFNGTSITELPESLTANICKLEVVNFGFDCKFPKDIKNWVELRRFETMESCSEMKEKLIRNLPRGIEKLTRLEVLEPYYMVRKEDDACSYNSSSSSIQELGDLNSLWKLEIRSLENVRGGKLEAEKAKLKDKQNIQRLHLKWEFKEEEEEGEEEEEVVVNNSVMVLEGLRPHPNLERLWIYGFPGLKLPKWMGSSSCLPNLVELWLYKCNSCEKLVGLGQLPCLQILEIEGMNSVKCLGEEFYYQQVEEEDVKESKGFATTTTLFPSLTALRMQKLENLEEWFAPDNSFPCIEEVDIHDCGNLTSIPDLRLWTSSLKELTIWDCKKLKRELKAYDLSKSLPSVQIRLGGWWDDSDDSDNTDIGFNLNL